MPEPTESGAVELTEENLNLVRDNLNEIAKTLDVSIDTQNKDIENKDKQMDKILKENVIDKTKTILKPDERKRFLEISKIFINEWILQIKKLQEAQAQKGLLSGDIPMGEKKKKKPFEFLSFFKKGDKDTKKEKPKSSTPWWKKLLLFVGGIGLIYAFFKNSIQQIPDKVWNGMKSLAKSIGNTFSNLMSESWEWIKIQFDDLWGWIKKTLGLDELWGYITGVWDKLAGWLDETWNTIKSGWKSFSDMIMNLPGTVWKWICDSLSNLLEPVIQGLKEAWDWICGIVSGAWNWLCEQFGKLWEGIKSAFNGIVKFFSGIWDWVCENFSFKKIWDNVSGFIMKKINNIIEGFKLLITGDWKKLGKLIIDDTVETLKFLAGPLWDAVAGWFSSDDDKKEKEKVKSKVEKTRNKKEIKNDVRTVLSQKEEITLKDNLLETVKDICDRINIFFSDKKGGFIDLSTELIKATNENFSGLMNQLKGLKLQNVYNMENDIEYNDDYDQSDRSTKTINNDYSKTVTDEFKITYNNLDLKSINRAIDILNNQTDQEINYLKSQNNYLGQMINTISGLSKDLQTFDSAKFENKEPNGIVPIYAQDNRPPKDIVVTTILKEAQNLFGSIFKD